MTADVLDRVRTGCARVMERARHVRIEPDPLARLARELAATPGPPAEADPAHLRLPDPDHTVAFVVTLGAVNFGSGWFPRLRKRPGLSGYYTVATALRERFELRGPWSAAELRRLTPAACAEVFGQSPSAPEPAELMGIFARSLADLGAWLQARHGGSFRRAVAAAGGSAAALVEALAAMPLYRDVAAYGDLEVPFYKRAQLTAADLAAAFGGKGPGRFRDLHRLTAFADNLVPHVLRCEGVLVYTRELAAQIDAGELLAPESPEEVEIRAGAVEAVERCVDRIAAEGGRATAHRLDALLWHRGQRPELKARPRHRTRTPFY